MVCIYNGIICSHQKKRNLAFCNDMDGTRGYYAEQNKSMRERQLSYDLPDMKNLRGNMRGLWGREGNHKRLLISQNKLRAAGGGG